MQRQAHASTSVQRPLPQPTPCGALQVTIAGRPDQVQGTTLNVAGRRGLLQLPRTFNEARLRLLRLTLVNLPYDASLRDCRSAMQALMHWAPLHASLTG